MKFIKWVAKRIRRFEKHMEKKFVDAKMENFRIKNENEKLRTELFEKQIEKILKDNEQIQTHRN